MNLTSSDPFWSVSNGLPANCPSVQRNVACDAVIIAGGITGALVAVHLAEAGVKTLLTTENGCRVIARRASIAAGFESKARLPGEAGILKSTCALISEPLPAIVEWHRQCLVGKSGTPYPSRRNTPEGRVIIGGEDEDFANAKRRSAWPPCPPSRRSLPDVGVGDFRGEKTP